MARRRAPTTPSGCESGPLSLSPRKPAKCVLTFTPVAKQMAEARAAEVLGGPGVDALVLAEHEAARQGGLSRRHPAPEAVLRPLADLAAAQQRHRDQGDDPGQHRQ
jgi:hypothetical protein